MGSIWFVVSSRSVSKTVGLVVDIDLVPDVDVDLVVVVVVVVVVGKRCAYKSWFVSPIVLAM